jgi:hypothetical protein
MSSTGNTERLGYTDIFVCSIPKTSCLHVKHKERIYECLWLFSSFFTFSLSLLHSATLLKTLLMSSRLTPFQASQPHGQMSLAGLCDAVSSLEDGTPTSNSTGSGLNTPLYEHHLLSPLDFPSPTNNTFRVSGGSMANETSAYKRLFQQNVILQNELRAEKEAHSMLRYVL